MREVHNYLDNTRWIRLANLTDEMIPPYSAVRVWPWKVDSTGAIVWAVGDYQADPQNTGQSIYNGLLVGNIAVTNGVTISAGSESKPSYGLCTLDEPALARVADADTGEGVELSLDFDEFSGAFTAGATAEDENERRQSDYEDGERGFGKYPRNQVGFVSLSTYTVAGVPTGDALTVPGGGEDECLAFVVRTRSARTWASNRTFAKSGWLYNTPVELETDGERNVMTFDPVNSEALGSGTEEFYAVLNSGHYWVTFSATVGIDPQWAGGEDMPNGTLIPVAVRYTPPDGQVTVATFPDIIGGDNAFIWASRLHLKTGATYSGDLFFTRENVSASAVVFLQAGGTLSVIHTQGGTSTDPNDPVQLIVNNGRLSLYRLEGLPG